MQKKLNLYLILMLLIPPVIWGAMMYLTEIVTIEELQVMAASPRVIIYLLAMLSVSLFWVNRVVARKLVTSNQDKLIQRTGLWFPVQLIGLMLVNALLGQLVASSSLAGLDKVDWIAGIVFAIAEAFTVSIPFYVLAVNEVDRYVGERAFAGGNMRHFPLGLRIGSGLVGVIFSSLVAVGALFVYRDIMLARTYGFPVEEITGFVSTVVIFVGALGLSGAGFVLVVMSSLNFSMGSLAKQLKKAVESGSDLTVSLPVAAMDETGIASHFFNLWLGKLNEIINRVKDSGAQLASFSKSLEDAAHQSGEASQHAAGAVQQISAGAEGQAKNLDDLNDDVQVLKNAIKELESVTASIKAQAQEAAALGDTGQNTINSANISMEKLSSATQAVAVSVQEMAEAASAISKATEVIGGVADETKLLALNAAIEAARAGEQGRGFAVVASEVRELAEDSSKSTEEIGKLVGEVQQKAKETNDLVSNASKIFEESLNAVSEAGQSFGEVQKGADETSTAVVQLASSLQEVSNSVERAAGRVGEIATVSQETAASAQNTVASVEEGAALAEEVAASAEKLSQLADSLQQVVGEFKLK